MKKSELLRRKIIVDEKYVTTVLRTMNKNTGSWTDLKLRINEYYNIDTPSSEDRWLIQFYASHSQWNAILKELYENNITDITFDD